MDSETWHNYARNALHFSELNLVNLKLLELFAYRHHRYSNEKLNIVLSGIKFENPLMVGAGWDKNGETVKAWSALGAAGVEVGTVVPNPQKGNDKPRQFIMNSGVCLNRLGFNSPGMEVVAWNLEKYRNSNIPIGISVGKNKNTENKNAPNAYAAVLNRLYPFASYVAINVSSPNTPNLRDLQEKSALVDIVHAIKGVMNSRGGKKPIFIKIAPELTNTAIDDVMDVVQENNLSGIIATNTTINPEIKRRYGKENEAGGISGNDPEFRKMATEKIAHIFKETNGQIEIIGVGGINSVEAALEKIMAGAKMLQIVTGIREEGPAIFGKINRELVDYMNKSGVNNISELVGQSTSIRYSQ